MISKMSSLWSVLVASLVLDGKFAQEIDVKKFICFCSRQTGKLIFGAPFFLFTLVFRALGLALLICFLQVWSGVIIFSLFFINVLTAMIVGDDFLRSCTFALWSLLVPVGYSR